jgi:hypothetical protein
MPDRIFQDPKKLGWGHVSGKLTVFNNLACSAPVVQMHEIGHNFGLGHASENGEEYGDLSGVMGGGDAIDDERMCFNAPHSYQLGWLRNFVEYYFQPGPGNITLVGHTNFGGGIQALLLQGIPTLVQDTYIWFNHASGINADTREGKNQVLVAHRLSGTMTNWTFLDAKLDVGGSYPMGDYAPVQVLSIVNGQATIIFNDLLPRPTRAPTLSPAPSGVPSDAPSPPPTPVPIVCPKTKKRSECPEGGIFNKKTCKAPKVPKEAPKGGGAPKGNPKDLAASIII